VIVFKAATQIIPTFKIIMKKKIAAVILFTVVTFGIKAQSWGSAEREAFLSNCIPEAENTFGPVMARHYCYCMLDKIEAAYPNPLDLNDMDEESLQPMAVNCIQVQKNWAGAEVDTFMENCTSSAEEGLGRERANDYCSCMLYKLMALYPNAATVGNVSEEEINRLAGDCLGLK
jgi:hypothetical protein